MIRFTEWRKTITYIHSTALKIFRVEYQAIFASQIQGWGYKKASPRTDDISTRGWSRKSFERSPQRIFSWLRDENGGNKRKSLNSFQKFAAAWFYFPRNRRRPRPLEYDIKFSVIRRPRLLILSIRSSGLVSEIVSSCFYRPLQAPDRKELSAESGKLLGRCLKNIALRALQLPLSYLLEILAKYISDWSRILVFFIIVVRVRM